MISQLGRWALCALLLQLALAPVGPMVLDPNDYNLGNGLKKVLHFDVDNRSHHWNHRNGNLPKTHPGPDQLQAALESDKAVVQANKASDAIAEAKTVAKEPNAL